jgi:hypothetical protein
MLTCHNHRELGKVTNWFRNLRQSARKREKKLGRRHSTGSDDDLDYTDGYGTGFYSPSASASVSRSGTPSLERDEGRRGRRRPHLRLHPSDESDEEDAQEAVTPSPPTSFRADSPPHHLDSDFPPLSPSPALSPTRGRVLDFSVAAALHDAMITMSKLGGDQKLTADALLLLEFQATCQ